MSILPDKIVIVFIRSFPVSPWQANCYLLATNEGEKCVIIDPGWDSYELVKSEVKTYGLTPVAMLGTHGHIDHIGDAAKLTTEYDIPLYLHPGDINLLKYPAEGLSPDLAAQLKMLLGKTELELPTKIIEIQNLHSFELAGIKFMPHHAPGHTPGSTLFEFRYGTEKAVFTGDVIFAGTIGRTDFPGGSVADMNHTLREVVCKLDPDMTLLPGHMNATTVKIEMAVNPFMPKVF